MRVVKFRKAISVPITKDTNVTERIIVTLEIPDSGVPSSRTAFNYLEDAIKAFPEKVGEPAIVEHLYGICEGCNHSYPHGAPCPVKAYLETEVLK